MKKIKLYWNTLSKKGKIVAVALGVIAIMVIINL
mgnify:FL=1|tara:strand:- start:10997 stop:11098 length:102 start_codon:yes stop_codon:yes gene_type:complete